MSPSCASDCCCTRANSISPKAIEAARQTCLDRRLLGRPSRTGRRVGRRRAVADHVRSDRTAAACGGYECRLLDRSGDRLHYRLARPQSVRECRAAQSDSRRATGWRRDHQAGLSSRRPVYQTGFPAHAISRWKLDLNAVKQSLQAYDQTALHGKNRPQPQTGASTGPQAWACPASRSESFRRARPGTTI